MSFVGRYEKKQYSKKRKLKKRSGLPASKTEYDYNVYAHLAFRACPDVASPDAVDFGLNTLSNYSNSAMPIVAHPNLSRHTINPIQSAIHTPVDKSRLQESETEFEKSNPDLFDTDALLNEIDPEKFPIPFAPSSDLPTSDPQIGNKDVEQSIYNPATPDERRKKASQGLGISYIGTNFISH